MGEQDFKSKLQKRSRTWTTRSGNTTSSRGYFSSAGLIFAGVIFTIAAGDAAERCFPALRIGCPNIPDGFWC
jgi:hypothetical protein